MLSTQSPSLGSSKVRNCEVGEGCIFYPNKKNWERILGESRSKIRKEEGLVRDNAERRASAGRRENR